MRISGATPAMTAPAAPRLFRAATLGVLLCFSFSTAACASEQPSETAPSPLQVADATVPEVKPYPVDVVPQTAPASTAPVVTPVAPPVTDAPLDSSAAGQAAAPAEPLVTVTVPLPEKPFPTSFPIANASRLSTAAALKRPVPETWRPLVERLVRDGFDRTYLHGLFGRMGDAYSHIPMGTKVRELYGYRYEPRPPRKDKRPELYPGVVCLNNAERCKAYLKKHAAAFARMEKTMGVPKELVVSLMQVETRLGDYMGRDSALWSLASMAAATTPERVAPTLAKLEMTPDRMEWLRKILRERSNWAYTELKALLKHSRSNKLDPLGMPGSVYGAIGLCQFMPSNLPKFAVDGDNDGKVDLFNPADAIMSVANYLKKHGWQADTTRTHRSLKRYNNSSVYANTIMALSDAVAAPPEKLAEMFPPKAKKITVASAAKNKKSAVRKGRSRTKKSATKSVAKRSQTTRKSAARKPG